MIIKTPTKHKARPAICKRLGCYYMNIATNTVYGTLYDFSNANTGPALPYLIPLAKNVMPTAIRRQ